MPARKQPIDAERLATLAEGIVDVDAKLDNLKSIRATLVTEVLRLHGDDGNYPAGELTVKVSRQRRLDLDAIEAKYPVDQRPELYELKATTAAVRRHIAPADLDTFINPSAASVKVV